MGVELELAGCACVCQAYFPLSRRDRLHGEVNICEREVGFCEI